MFQRHLQDVVRQRLREEPVVILTGAHTVGKSALLGACARDFGVDVLDLDDLATREAVSADPTLFVHAGRPSPVCVNEFPREPRLVHAIKAELNSDLRPGRFVLTGPTRFETSSEESLPLTGLAHVITVWPLSQGEISGHRETALDVLMSDPSKLVTRTLSTTTRQDYQAMILSGGFPLALARPAGAARTRWFQDFSRMVAQHSDLNNRKFRFKAIPLILRHVAARTGRVLKISEIAKSVELDPRVVSALVAVLESVFVVHRLSAFGRRLSTKVGLSAKMHLVDSGLAAHLLGVSETRLASQDSAILAEFQQVATTFAVNELHKQAGWSSQPVSFSHFRTYNGHQVDLIAEAENGDISGIVVTAKPTITDNDLRGLRLLRHKLGDDFIGGTVLTMGQRAHTPEDRIHVVPLDRLWTSP